MSYGFFAEYYDFFTDNINYKAYAARVRKIAKELKISGGKAIDLGCGTGSLSIQLAKHGYAVTGFDLSNEMIGIAKEKLKSGSNAGISESCRFIIGDITRLDTFIENDSCKMAVSSMDVLNHLTDFGAVEKVFGGVGKVLVKGGVFIFDMNTIYKHRHILADNCFVFDSDRAYLGWQNDYFEHDNSVKITLDFFIPDSIGYSRHTECFIERAYPAKSIAQTIERNGMKLVALYDGLSCKKPVKTTQRVLYVAVKE